ncbi:MAG: class I SAM-dependent methyltransferase [Candidatus Dormibacteria bacterium]
MSSTPDDDMRIAANRDNGDDRVAIHFNSRFYDVEGWLRDKKGPRPWEQKALGDVSGLHLVHLQCHFGLDTLAWARAGASVVGLDFAPSAIATAKSLAERSGLAASAEFVCARDGALGWLPSVDRWAEQVAGLLRAGGRVYIHDGHPLAWALADDRLAFAHTYFEESERPLVDDSGATYTDSVGPPQHTRTYEWNHSIGEIVTALSRHGLHLNWLIEHDWTVWPRFRWLIEQPDGRWSLPPDVPRVPLTFGLLATRPR